MLSPYIDYTVGSEQYIWLLNDLQAINRTTTPWVRTTRHPATPVAAESHGSGCSNAHDCAAHA